MRFVIAALIFLVSTSAVAAESRTERAERISRALGLGEMLKTMQDKNAASAQRSIRAVMNELRKGGLPEAYLNRLTESAEKATMDAAGAWDPKEASRIFSEGLIDFLSDEELAEMEKFYDSEQGKRSYQALTQSQGRMVEYIQGKTEAALQEAMGKFLAEAKEVANKVRQEQAAAKKAREAAASKPEMATPQQ